MYSKLSLPWKAVTLIFFGLNFCFLTKLQTGGSSLGSKDFWVHSSTNKDIIYWVFVIVMKTKWGAALWDVLKLLRRWEVLERPAQFTGSEITGGQTQGAAHPSLGRLALPVSPFHRCLLPQSLKPFNSTSWTSLFIQTHHCVTKGRELVIN